MRTRFICALCIIIIFSFSIATAHDLPYAPYSRDNLYKLEPTLSAIYGTAVYGNHFGSFTAWEEGWDS
jgi:hypothetical protein